MKSNSLKHRDAVKKTIIQFENLSGAVIDSSSVIYMHKCNFLSLLSRAIKIIIPEQAYDEINLNLNQITVVSFNNIRQYETDYIILKIAIESNSPVISEDREILKHAADKNIPYFNSLMMLNFLVYKKIINSSQYNDYLDILKKFAWYGKHIYKYADDVHYAVIHNIC
ncbi:MAG: hypothetical protein JW982_10740 [Spirochaetes bacterium]|nr:hypothetical protein [Spirochaetota bacterium]